MAIQITSPYRPETPNVLAAVKAGLDAQLAREHMIVQEARAQQEMARKEREDQRQYEQNQRRAALEESKFEYQQKMGMPGGLDWMRTMSAVAENAAQTRQANVRTDSMLPGGSSYLQTQAEIDAVNARAEASRAQAGLYERRAEEPQAFWKPSATSVPKPTPLTAKQRQINTQAVIEGYDPPFREGAPIPSQAYPAGMDPNHLSGYTNDAEFLADGSSAQEPDNTLLGTPPPQESVNPGGASAGATPAPGPAAPRNYVEVLRERGEVERSVKDDKILADYASEVSARNKDLSTVQRLNENTPNSPAVLRAQQLLAEAEARLAEMKARLGRGAAPAGTPAPVTTPPPASAPAAEKPAGATSLMDRLRPRFTK